KTDRPPASLGGRRNRPHHAGVAGTESGNYKEGKRSGHPGQATPVGPTRSWPDESKRKRPPPERRAPRRASSPRERLLELLKKHTAGGQSLPLRSGNATTLRLTSPHCSERTNGYLLRILASTPQAIASPSLRRCRFVAQRLPPRPMPPAQ